MKKNEELEGKLRVLDNREVRLNRTLCISMEEAEACAAKEIRAVTRDITDAVKVIGDEYQASRKTAQQELTAATQRASDALKAQKAELRRAKRVFNEREAALRVAQRTELEKMERAIETATQAAQAARDKIIAAANAEYDGKMAELEVERLAVMDEFGAEKEEL